MSRIHHTHLNRLCELVGHGSLLHGGHQSLGSEDLRVSEPSLSHWRKGNEFGDKRWRCEDDIHGEILRFHAEGENAGEMVSLLHPQLKEEGYEAGTDTTVTRFFSSLGYGS